MSVRYGTEASTGLNQSTGSSSASIAAEWPWTNAWNTLPAPRPKCTREDFSQLFGRVEPYKDSYGRTGWEEDPGRPRCMYCTQDHYKPCVFCHGNLCLYHTNRVRKGSCKRCGSACRVEAVVNVGLGMFKHEENMNIRHWVRQTRDEVKRRKTQEKQEAYFGKDRLNPVSTGRRMRGKQEDPRFDPRDIV